MVLFLRPELFIAVIVIQRLWFGSSYNEKTIEKVKNPGTISDPSKSTHSADKDTIRRKSWDIIVLFVS